MEEEVWPKLVKVSTSLHWSGGGGCSLAMASTAARLLMWEMEVTEPAPFGFLTPK